MEIWKWKKYKDIPNRGTQGVTVETHETGHLTFRKSCVCDNDGLFTYATVQDQIRMARRYSRTHFHDGSLALIKR